MKILQKIFIYSLIGIGAGNLMALIFSFSYGEFSPGVPEFINEFSSMNIAVLVQTSIYALLGGLQGIARNIFKHDDRSLNKMFIVHYLVVIIPLISAGYILKWYSSIRTLIYMIVFSSIIYFLIAFFSYLSISNDIKKINRKLNG